MIMIPIFFFEKKNQKDYEKQKKKKKKKKKKKTLHRLKNPPEAVHFYIFLNLSISHYFSEYSKK